MALALTSAVAWPNILPDMDAVIVRRQQNQPGTTPTNGPQPTNPPTQQSPTVKPTGSTGTSTRNNGPITTDLNTGGAIPTGSVTGTFKPSNGTSTKTKQMFNPIDPAGGAVMITPSAIYGMPLYKIEGTAATWVWNYTSIQGTPTAVDVLVSCAVASQTITLTQNMTYNSPQTFTWDHAEYAATAVSNRLLMEKYTLIVYDSDTEPTDLPSSGYLAPFSRFVFGLYAKQEYHDLGAGFQCVTCSGAHGSLERNAIGFAASMSIITILSFTWFVGGVGAML